MKRWWISALAALALAATGARAAESDGGAADKGGGGDAPTDLSAPRSLTAPPPSKAEPEKKTEPRTTRDPAGPAIKVDELSGVDLDATGLMAADAGGLGRALWKGTDAARARQLMDRLPRALPARPLRRLQRRLLASTARPPAGTKGNGDFLMDRARALYRAGFAADAAALLAAIPRDALTNARARLLVRARLLAGDPGTGCSAVPPFLDRFDDPFWQKATVACQIHRDRMTEARFSLRLARETAPGDRLFYALAERALGLTAAPLESLDAPGPVDLLLVRAGEVALPDGTLANLGPGALAAVAAMPAAAVDKRLAAAERAERLGLVPADRLRALYKTVTFTEAERNKPLSAAADNPGPRSRALVYRVAENMDVPTARAEVMAWALARARRAGGYGRAARLYAPLIADMDPTGALGWFAAQAGRALYTAGRRDAADAWLALARGRREADEEAARALAALRPVARMAHAAHDAEPPRAVRDRAPAPPPAPVGTHADDGRAAGPAGPRERGSEFFALLDALGARVPVTAWRPMLEGPVNLETTLPHPAISAVLDRAADDGRRGETAALALRAFGGRDPATAGVPTLKRVVGALHRAGLDTPARRLALLALARYRPREE